MNKTLETKYYKFLISEFKDVFGYPFEESDGTDFDGYFKYWEWDESDSEWGRIKVFSGEDIPKDLENFLIEG